MSYLATQNLNPTYNTITATNLNATNISGVNVTPTTLTLKDPIVTSNISQPNISELGYFSNTQNSVEVELTSGTNEELVITPESNPVGVYQVNARVQLTIDAGVTINSYTLFIETTAGIILEKVETNPVTYADACSITPTLSVSFFNQSVQQFQIFITATFTGGNVVVEANDAKLYLVRIA